MTKQQLITKLEDIEWEDFEVKEAASELPKSIWETVSAFSNSAGGWIVLGVKQNGKRFEITGVSRPEKIEQDFINTLRSEKFNIKIRPLCKKYHFDNKTVLAFYIPVSDHKPIYYNTPSNSYIRTASGDQKASKEEVDAMYRDQRFGTKTSKIIKDSVAGMLHKESVQEYRDYLRRLGQSHPYNKLTEQKFLEKLRVVEKEKLTYSGLLFFGSNDSIQSVFNDFRIDYLEIPGISYQDASVRYTFRLDEQENLWQYFFALFRRLSGTIDLPFKLTTEGFATEDQPQLSAIREALINLLMHTDYFSFMKPRIRVFTDRIEFLNPGTLPQSLAKIRAGDLSLPRNPIIAKLFRMVNLAENAGYGFDKMEAGWQQYSHTKPVFEQGIDYTKVEFYFPSKGGQKSGQKGGQKSGQKILTPRQKQAYELIKANQFISRKEMAAKLSMNESALRKHLDGLRQKGIIKREGPDKGGYWKILEDIQ